MQFTERLLNNSSVRVKISCLCPPCYCWNAELCFTVFVVKFIVYVYACGPKPSQHKHTNTHTLPSNCYKRSSMRPTMSNDIKLQTILQNDTTHTAVYSNKPNPTAVYVVLSDLRTATHDDVIKWKHFLRFWPFVRGIHLSSVNSPRDINIPDSLHKGQWHRALMFSLICAWINGWVNNRDACDLRRHRAHYEVTVMIRRKIRSICRN